MNFPFAEQFSQPLAGSTRTFRAAAIAVAAVIVLNLLAFPSAAQAQQSPLPASAAGAASAASAASDVDAAAALDISADGLPPDETKNLPKLELTRQVVFQVLAAEIALQRGQVASAYQTYMALAQDTHDPRASQRATEIALAAQSASDALAAAQLWHKDAPDSEQAAQLDASLLVLNGELEQAKPLLVAHLAKVPDAERARAILSLQLLVGHGPDRIGGMRMLQSLLVNDLQRPEAQLAIARQQLIANDQPAARTSLENALKLRPGYEAAALLLAQLGAPERQEAIASLTDYLQKNPDARDARIALAQIYLADGQLDAAEREFTAMRQRNPDDLPPLLALGLIRMQQKRVDDAQRYFEQYAQQAEAKPAVNTDPAQAYVYLSQIALQHNDIPAALGWLQKIPPTSAQYLPAQISRAQLLTQQKKFAEARGVLAALRPADPRDQIVIGRADAGVLMQQQHYAEAEQRLASLLQAYPSDPDLIYDYAMSAERNHHYDVMETQLRKLIALQPNNAQAYNALGYSLADRNERLPEAQTLIEKASALAPNDPFIMDSLGWVRFRSGDKAQAIQTLQHAYQIQPNAEIGAHLGEALWTDGKQDEARHAWHDALKLEADNETLLQTLKRFGVANP